MQVPSRKRPAPGTSPAQPTTQQEQYPNFEGVTDPSQLSNDQLLSWGANDFALPNDNPQNYMSVPGGIPASGYNQAQQQPTNQLVRRNMNNQLQASASGMAQTGLEPWQEYEGTPPLGTDAGDESAAELDARAAAAKRDAQAKRKQIPPFIQKLVSFLDKNYTDLIRWSDAGDSFIVVDEDKFAQKLIPELFKHNNYASFVRQLNMYGFHKVVGLSDNSMRQSEKKSKTPSEYKHKYFKRGKPDLLWLIEKPKSGTSGTKKKNVKQEAHEEDDDDNEEVADAHNEETHGHARAKDLSTVSKADVDAFRNLRKEVEALQKSQQQIFAILARMRDENNQYIRQASTMVANHERHESSINAILTFLATFYNQSLENGANAGNMFSHTIHDNQPRGSVYDVGDYGDSSMNQPAQFPPQGRRPLALLPPPTASEEQHGGQRASSTPRTEATTPRRSSQTPRQQNNFGSKPSPPQTARDSPSQAKDNDEILDVINRSNANPPQSTQNGPNFDFNTALQHYQNSNGNVPLTPEQRNAMLSIMANRSGTSTPAITNDGSNSNNYLDYLNSNQEQLEMLQRLQEEQDSKVQELAGRLTPLSPSGSIPGLNLPNQSPTFNPSLPYSGSFDINNFINDDYLDGNDNNDTNPDFDFGSFGGDGSGGENNSFGMGDDAADATQDQDQSGAIGSHDGSLFGDDDDAGETPDTASVKVESATPGPGRIVGSVASSSSRPSPSVEDADGGNEEGSNAQAAEEENPSKRRRTTRR